MNHRISSFADYLRTYDYSVNNPEEFWAEIADSFDWKQKWQKVLDFEFDTPSINWFSGGKLNITENCLDRHVRTNPNKIALISEPNDPNQPTRQLSYQQLLDEVSKFANVLKNQSIKKGDRVCIYMPMVPELVIAVLACARIGAIHSVVFAGFSSQSLSERTNDSACSLVVTSDWLFRGEKKIKLKQIVDEALANSVSVKSVIVFKMSDEPVEMKAERDHWWHELMRDSSPDCPAEVMDSEDELFILYTSGSTGKPKGIVHTTAGYMVYAYYTFLNVFQHDSEDIFWCTADIGWITGHTYLTYGPLLNGATTVMFEGVPNWPDPGRLWSTCDKLHVTKFYTAPTVIRSLMAAGDDYVKPYKLDSLKVLGSVGEPINEEAWEWYYKNVGKSRCPVVDTWWQTETGGIMISPLAGITELKPAWASLPLPGVQPLLVDNGGKEVTEPETEGLLCFKFPWPGIARATYQDLERFKQTYFGLFQGLYFSGDAAKKDSQGNYRIIGRVDDVINVSGHRLGTAEIESAINEHEDVVESAVVGFPHDIKGQGIYAFVVIASDEVANENITEEIGKIVAKVIGSIAKPDQVQIVRGLPKTRSGKIMRRILRKVVVGETDFGDISTLVDPSVIADLKTGKTG